MTVKGAPIYQGSQGNQTFYVPAFAVKLAGRNLSQDVIRDVMQVTYTDTINDIDAFELTINNWDAAKRTCKYEGDGATHQNMFDPGQKLEIAMGYLQPTANGKSSLTEMMTGQITTLEPDFPNSGAPTLHVRGLNILHSFRRVPHTYTWKDKKDSEIAQELGRKQIQKTLDAPGLDIEVRIDSSAMQSEVAEPIIFMQNRYDIVFLLERARKHGYIVTLEEKDEQKYLYFGPSKRTIYDAHETYRLEWGKSLLQFRPTFNTATQVASVTVLGWDREKQEPIKTTATWGEGIVRINMDQKDTLKDKELKDRNAVIADKPVYTEQEAQAMATQMLLEHLKTMITASGSTVGLPRLRAGTVVEIYGLGERFNGTYFITSTTHTIGDDGYRTTFNARREQL